MKWKFNKQDLAPELELRESKNLVLGFHGSAALSVKVLQLSLLMLQVQVSSV